MTDKHTPEPWGIDDWQLPDGWYRILDRTGRYIVTCSLENARRIVACVNACKGIPTEWLESYGKNGGLQTCRKSGGEYYDALQKVLSELLEGQPPALSDCVAVIEEVLGEPGSID